MKYWILIIPIILMFGCGPNTSELEDEFTQPFSAGSNNRPKQPRETQKIQVEAGVPLNVATNLSKKELSEEYTAHAQTEKRTNPFALLPNEKAFYNNLEEHRIFGEIGGFLPPFEPEEEKTETKQPFEKQPFRRLMGVMVSGGIEALIEMEDRKVYNVKPGQKIPNSEWILAEVNYETATLRRTGNKLPKEVKIAFSERSSGPIDIKNTGYRGEQIEIDDPKETQKDKKMDEADLDDLSEPFYKLPRSYKKRNLKPPGEL